MSLGKNMIPLFYCTNKWMWQLQIIDKIKIHLSIFLLNDIKPRHRDGDDDKYSWIDTVQTWIRIIG